MSSRTFEEILNSPSEFLGPEEAKTLLLGGGSVGGHRHENGRILVSYFAEDRSGKTRKFTRIKADQATAA